MKQGGKERLSLRLLKEDLKLYKQGVYDRAEHHKGHGTILCLHFSVTETMMMFVDKDV